MKISRRAVTLGSLSLLAGGSIGSVARANLASQELVLSAAVDAYIYGYPLAIMEISNKHIARRISWSVRKLTGAYKAFYTTCKVTSPILRV